MHSKRPNTLHILLIVLAVIIYFNSYYLPLKNETKKSLGYPLESLLNFTELTTSYGYVTEEHEVTTEDGYILQLFRITQGVHCKGEKKKTPVILMHGLFESSDLWLDAGPQDGLAYLLADACYDLWLGNQRGNYYSRKHKFLDPDQDPEYWQFSLDEFGVYDNPAIIDFVLNNTGMDKLNIIGYSQGSAVSFVMCSEKPEYCNKVNVHIGLSPAVRMSNTKSLIFNGLLEVTYGLKVISSAIGVNIQEVLAKGSFLQELLWFLCQVPYVSNNVCDKFLALLDSGHPGSLSTKTTQLLFSHFPAGTSVQNIIRLRQNNKSNKFAKFDHGVEKNLELYGMPDPPDYNLTAVSTPVVIFYSPNDYLVDIKDIKWLTEQLTNVVEVIEVNNLLYNHLDIPYSQYTKELIFPKVNEYLEKYSNR